MRCLLLFVAAGMATAAEGWSFTGAPRTYLYEVKQAVAWDSAGDHLAFTTELAWKVLLEGRGAKNGRAELAVTVVRVVARHNGPGSDRRYDSAQAADDALLGHLKAVEGATLVLAVDPHSGQVKEVRGTEAIVEAVARRAPNLADPGAPSPLAEAARTAYAPERLARLWSQALARPAAASERVPLGEPLTGEAVRSWSGDAWTLALPEGVTSLPVTLLGEPTPVAGTVSRLSGSGKVQARDGWPAATTGELAFTLDLGALTQPVHQTHRVTWTLSQQQP